MCKLETIHSFKLLLSRIKLARFSVRPSRALPKLSTFLLGLDKYCRRPQNVNSVLNSVKQTSKEKRGSTLGQTRCHPKTTGTNWGLEGSTGMWNGLIWLKYVGQSLVLVPGPGVTMACLLQANQKTSCLVYSSLQTHSRLTVRAKWEECSSAAWSWLQLDIGPAVQVGSMPG